MIKEATMAVSQENPILGRTRYKATIARNAMIDKKTGRRISIVGVAADYNTWLNGFL
jgi:hypothetical protein